MKSKNLISALREDNERVYCGSRNETAPYIGQCFTDSQSSAETYAGSSGFVYSALLNLNGLKICTVDGYDRDNNTSPGDSKVSLAQFQSEGADVIIFDDEDIRGREHKTIRIISSKAILALSQFEQCAEM